VARTGGTYRRVGFLVFISVVCKIIPALAFFGLRANLKVAGSGGVHTNVRSTSGTVSSDLHSLIS
jgi:hypothetical protein